MRSRRLALFSAVVAPVGLLWAACSVPARPNDRIEPLPCVEGCPEVDASLDSPVDTAQVNLDGRVDVPTRSSSCGPDTGCTPDRDLAVWTCGGSLIQQGASTSPGSTPQPQPLFDASFGGSGADPTNPSPTPPVLACQVVALANKEAATVCRRTGLATEGGACRGDVVGGDGELTSDCAPGLACVRSTDGMADGTVGQCRPYCCLGGAVCGVGSWCAQRPLFGSTAQFVPVCARADNCTLLEPGACPPIQGTAQACVLVADRTTSCDVPGKNLAGGPCSCAEGYACVSATNTCRQICRLGSVTGCKQGVCVGGGDVLPPGYGLCVAS